MRELGVSQAELGRRVGISQQAINKLVNRESSNSKHISQIATALDTSPAYLLGQTDDPAEGAPLTPTAEIIADQLDLVAIDEIDLPFGMGGTNTDNPVEVRKLHFPRSWLNAITSTPASQLVFARGKGDSMLPTLLDGDIVLVDKTRRGLDDQDALWALTIGTTAMIKRVRMRADGRITIISDNPLVPKDEVAANELVVVGRVIFVGRRT